MLKSNNKVFIFYLILLSAFLTLFKLADSSISVTYGDFVSLFIVLLFINDLFKNYYKFPRYAKYWMFYIIILFVSAIVNLTFFEGRFLNIFKTNIVSLIYFIILYSLVVKNEIKIKTLMSGIMVLGLAFLVKTWPEMQKAWAIAENEFTNVNIFDSSLNLNTWGFILILFLIVMLYSWVSKIHARVAIISCVILVVFIFFSYSRAAYSLTALVLIWSIFYINKSNFKNLILPVLLIGIIFIFRNQLNVFNFNISESALSFLDKKSGNYSEDLINTRFYLINIKPFIESYESFNPLQMLIGDGVSVQHSFISHSLIVTGILGFIVFMKRFLYAVKYCIYRIKKNSNVVPAKFLILIILVVLINDFVTNISSFLPFAAYLSAVIMAFLFAEINTNKQLKHDARR